ncbi:hypothetical protein JZ751_024163 [Albula glossodonta]|uniref:Uncharacterized protein n=1 Tax=Albula glossodonta TaxID=121402 RepID=A0A8T2NNE7_9TELE|nr:hypothetical protein JZ751_024163 [Albula glossodonta]
MKRRDISGLNDNAAYGFDGFGSDRVDEVDGGEVQYDGVDGTEGSQEGLGLLGVRFGFHDVSVLLLLLLHAHHLISVRPAALSGQLLSGGYVPQLLEHAHQVHHDDGGEHRLHGSQSTQHITAVTWQTHTCGNGWNTKPMATTTNSTTRDARSPAICNEHAIAAGHGAGDNKRVEEGAGEVAYAQRNKLL